MSKSFFALICCFLACVVAVYIMFLNKAPWSIISLYWVAVAIKNWKDVE